MSFHSRKRSSNYLPRVLGIIAVLSLLHGCGGSSSGGEQVIVAAPSQPAAQCRIFIVDKDHADAADSNDGRYKVDGGNGPWKTIQHAIDHAQPCDTVRVRASVIPYSEGEKTGGIVIANGGEKDRPLTLEGFPGERPVIDQQQNGIDTLTTGFILQCSSWITLRNFEIRNIADAGVSTALTGCASNDITLEKLHIHSVYGGNLVAAIRLAGIKNVTLRDNRISDVFKVRNDDMSIANMNSEIENIAIENNVVANTEQAITITQQNPSITTTYNTDSKLTISNNTLANTTRASIALENIQGISIFNNIVTASAGGFMNISGETQIALLDYNLYWSAGAAEWTVEKNSVTRTFTTFAEWKSAYSLEQLTPFAGDPDQNSKLDDPLFINAANNDYLLAPNSPALNAGVGGKTMGAHFDDEEAYRL